MNNITGLLLHAPNGNFVQLIEGDAEDVENVLSRITSDKRHHNISVFIDQVIEHRAFPDWEMGFADLLCSDQTKVEQYIREALRRAPGELALQLIPVFLMLSLHDAHADSSLASAFIGVYQGRRTGVAG